MAREEMMDIIISSLGFEHSEVISFCKLASDNKANDKIVIDEFIRILETM